MRLEQSVAVITGAGSGIGRALAVEAAGRGMRLVLVGRRAAALEETAGLAADGECLVVPADVTRADDRLRLAGALEERHGRVDLLVNNAGVVHAGPLAQCSDERIMAMLQTNVAAPLMLVRTLLPLLRAANGARVLNVGSMFGDIAFPFFVAYSATKFALRGASDALRRELAAEGIGVTYAAPRATRTPAADGFAALVGPMGMRMDSPGSVARRTLDAVARDARSVYPRGPERVLVLVQRLLPGLVDRSLSRLAARSEVRAAAAAPG
jgi:short-subunit dehydrogenase